MKMQVMKSAVATLAGIISMAGIAAASNVNVGVDVVTPNVRINAGSVPAPVTVVERERVIIREKDGRHDNGKHKGHYKKHKKHKKSKHHEKD